VGGVHHHAVGDALGQGELPGDLDPRRKIARRAFRAGPGRPGGEAGHGRREHDPDHDEHHHELDELEPLLISHATHGRPLSVR
jgi:hypothetical protein